MQSTVIGNRQMCHNITLAFITTTILMAWRIWVNQLPPLTQVRFSSTGSGKNHRDKWHKFYKLHFLPVTQPTVAKDWRKHKTLTTTSGLASFFIIHQWTYQYRVHCFLYTSSHVITNEYVKNMTFKLGTNIAIQTITEKLLVYTKT